jgi:hypothetical protein
MPEISEQEKQRRQRMVRSVLGTHAMEGLFPDEPSLSLMRRYEHGELTLDEFSDAMDAHAYSLADSFKPIVSVA